MLLFYDDFVKNTAIIEVGFLRFFPTAEDFINGDQFNFGKLLGVFCGDLSVARTVVVLARNFLTLF